MAKNLLRSVIQERIKARAPGVIDTKKVIEKIESGYLVDNKNGFKVKKSFSPSTLVYNHGECPRYWYLAFHGAEFIEENTPFQIANMRNGSLAHERIQKAMEDAGIMLEKEGKITHNDPPIFGYQDGELLWDEAPLPIEIKTTNDMSFARRKESGTALPYHIAQLVIYMHIRQREVGAVIYENKNTHELFVVPVEMLPEYKEWVTNLFDWARDVKKASDADLLPKKNYRSNSKICKACPLSEACSALPPEGDVEIRSLEQLK